MIGWKDGYIKKNQLLREITIAISKAHNLDIDDIIVNLEEDWKKMKYPTGLIGMRCKVIVRAKRFKTRDFIVTQCKNERWKMF